MPGATRNARPSKLAEISLPDLVGYCPAARRNPARDVGSDFGEAASVEQVGAQFGWNTTFTQPSFLSRKVL